MNATPGTERPASKFKTKPRIDMNKLAQEPVDVTASRRMALQEVSSTVTTADIEDLTIGRVPTAEELDAESILSQATPFDDLTNDELVAQVTLLSDKLIGVSQEREELAELIETSERQSKEATARAEKLQKLFSQAESALSEAADKNASMYQIVIAERESKAELERRLDELEAALAVLPEVTATSATVGEGLPLSEVLPATPENVSKAKRLSGGTVIYMDANGNIDKILRKDGTEIPKSEYSFLIRTRALLSTAEGYTAWNRNIRYIAAGVGVGVALPAIAASAAADSIAVVLCYGTATVVTVLGDSLAFLVAGTWTLLGDLMKGAQWAWDEVGRFGTALKQWYVDTIVQLKQTCGMAKKAPVVDSAT